MSPRLIPFVHDWAKKFPDEFYGKGHEFIAFYNANQNTFKVAKHPRKPSYQHGLGSIIRLAVNRNGQPDSTIYEMTLFTSLLTDMSKPKYTLYRVDFGAGISHLTMFDDTFAAFAAGYVGITKRPPLQRFREHMRDMVSGDGYLFHASWRALRKNLPGVIPSFTLSERANTLDEIYDLEEHYVGKYTMAPMGLNAIPGGRAGLRFLGMQSKGRNLPTIDHRDVALAAIANGQGKKCSHYRSGHVRNLPGGRKTWISPCWVNLAEVA